MSYRGFLPSRADRAGGRYRSGGSDSISLDRRDHVEYELKENEKNDSDDDDEEDNAMKQPEVSVNRTNVSADFRDGKLPANVHISTFGALDSAAMSGGGSVDWEKNGLKEPHQLLRQFSDDSKSIVDSSSPGVSCICFRIYNHSISRSIA